MGQRTMFITVAENLDGQVKVNGYYNQWGFGRIMPMAAMTAIMTDTRRGYGQSCIEGLTFNHEAQRFQLTFSYTGDKDNRLAVDCFNDPEMIGRMCDRQDNNNGAVVLYAKDMKDKEGHEGVQYTIGFLLGSEDEYKTFDGKEFNVEAKEYGRAFSRWLTLEEWAGLGINKDYTDEKFLSWFRGFLEYFCVQIKSWNN